MQYRLVVQFAKPEDSGSWETVVAPVFRTSAAEEDIYARVRQLVTELEGSEGAAAADPAETSERNSA